MTPEPENLAVPRVRVCCFCERWESGGIESFLCNILLHMDLSRLEVHIVSARLEESVFTPPLAARGVRFFQLSGKLRSPVNGFVFSDLLRKYHYDVVYLNIFQGLSFYYAFLAQKAGVPVRIAHSHGAGLRNCPGKVLKLGLHRIGKKLWSGAVTDFWACSRNAAEFLFPPGQDYRWISDGIETERFRFRESLRVRQRLALGVGGETFLVGTVGRLCWEKNHRFLLHVFFELKKMRKDCVLLIVGAGRLRKRLCAQARRLGLEHDVIFYGVSDHVERLLWAMDVFVFPSLMEGFGIAGVEAQAAGLPVLCSMAVPPEAVVTEQAVRFGLDAGARRWAERVSVMRDRGRDQDARLVAEAGFDVRDVAARIREKWLGGHDGV